MSVVQIVVLRRSRVPTAAQWQRLVLDAGFDLRWTADFSPTEHAGLLAVRMNGEPAAFELDFDDVHTLKVDHSAPDFEGRDCAFSFATGSSERDLAAATAAAACLAASIDGLVHDGAQFITGEEALRRARATVPGLAPKKARKRGSKGMQTPAPSFEIGSFIVVRDFGLAVIQGREGTLLRVELPDGRVRFLAVDVPEIWRGVMSAEQATQVLAQLSVAPEEITDDVEERLSQNTRASKEGDPLELARRLVALAALKRRGKGFFSDDKRFHAEFRDRLVEELTCGLRRPKADVEKMLEERNL